MSFYLTGKALLVMSARPWQDGPPLSDLGGVLQAFFTRRPGRGPRAGQAWPQVWWLPPDPRGGENGERERAALSGEMGLATYSHPIGRGPREPHPQSPSPNPVELVRGPSQPVGPWGTEQDGDGRTFQHRVRALGLPQQVTANSAAYSRGRECPARV